MSQRALGVGVALWILSFGQAFALDISDCQAQTERLRREARDAADAASSLSDRDRDALERTRSALGDVDSRLSRAQRACDARSSAQAEMLVMIADRENALRDVERWSEEKRRTDPRYSSIEDRLVRYSERLVKTTPPQAWLPSIQILYEALAGQ